MTDTSTAAERFDSLEALIQAHDELLQSDESSKPKSAFSCDVEEIRGFLRQAAATGAILDVLADRRQAQGVLDYWSATVYTEARQLNQRFSAEETILHPFDLSLVTRAAEQANEYLDQATEEEQRLAERILVRLTDFKPATQQFKAEALSEEDLLLMGNSMAVKQTLRCLEQAGVVRRVSPPDTDAASADTPQLVTLSSEALIRRWERLQTWLENRRQLRAAAVLWQTSNRDSSALLDDGPLLEQALSYRNLGDLEQEFADASRQKAQAAQRQKNNNLIIATCVMCGLSLVLVILTFSFFSSRNQLAANQKIITKKKDELNEKSKRLEAQTWQLKQQAQTLKEKNEALEVEKAAALANLIKVQEEERAAQIANDDYQQLAKNQRDLIQDIINKKLQGELSNELRQDVMEWQQELKRLTPPEPPEKPPVFYKQVDLYPGCKLNGGEDEVHFFGTASALFIDKNSEGFLILPGIFSTGTTITTPDGNIIPVTRSTARESFNPAQQKYLPVRDTSLLSPHRILPGVKATNKLQNGKVLQGTLEEVRKGMKVYLHGAGSNIREGIVITPNALRRDDREPYIIVESTTELPFSGPGDMGAPVIVEQDGKMLLIGILIGAADPLSREKKMVRPITPILKAHNLKLWQGNNPDEIWQAPRQNPGELSFAPPP